MEGIFLNEYGEVSKLLFMNELIPLEKEVAHSGPISISETSSITEWGNEIVETHSNFVDIVSEREYSTSIFSMSNTNYDSG